MLQFPRLARDGTFSLRSAGANSVPVSSQNTRGRARSYGAAGSPARRSPRPIDVKRARVAGRMLRGARTYISAVQVRVVVRTWLTPSTEFRQAFCSVEQCVSRVAKVKLCVFASARRMNCGHLGAAPLPAFAILRGCPPNTSEARGAIVKCAESGVAPSARSATQRMCTCVLASTRSCTCSSILETLVTLATPASTCAMPPAIGMPVRRTREAGVTSLHTGGAWRLDSSSVCRRERSNKVRANGGSQLQCAAHRVALR